MEKRFMLEALLVLGGILLGAGGATVAHNMNKKNIEPVVIKSHEGTEKAIQQLTNLDITKPLCDPEFIKEHGVILCREITCLQFSRGLDSKTAGAQCESISNIHNKIEIERWCNQYQDESLKQECIDLFWKRN
tara:strand:- start:581 stop:979 length:399 start_codon:yes stop_codon:yes gene_type:complete